MGALPHVLSKPLVTLTAASRSSSLLLRNPSDEPEPGSGPSLQLARLDRNRGIAPQPTAPHPEDTAAQARVTGKQVRNINIIRDETLSSRRAVRAGGYCM